LLPLQFLFTLDCFFESLICQNNNLNNINMSKQEIIGNIYFDKAGFGSKNTTLKDAREKNKSITMKDLEDFFKHNVAIKNKREATIALLLHITIIHTKLIYSLCPKKYIYKGKTQPLCQSGWADTQPLTRSGKSDSASHSATQPL
jgi:hypothetical protein